MKLFKFILFIAMSVLVGGVVAAKNAPIAVHAEESQIDYTLYLKADGTATKNYASGTVLESLPAGLSYDSDSNEWTMNNFTFNTTKANAVVFEAQDSKLNIIGNNTISAPNGKMDDNHSSRGLECKNLVIEGEGTLNVTSGDIESGASTSYGIIAEDLTLNGGNVYVTGGFAYASYGVKAKNLTVNDGYLSVISADSNYGYAVNATTTVNDGCLEVNGYISATEINIKEGLKVTGGADAETATELTFDTDWKKTVTGKKYVKIYEPTSSKPEKSGNNTGLVIGIVVGGVAAVAVGAYFAVGYLVFAKGKLKGKFFEKIYGWMKKSK